jgi:hypothetical protein
VGAGLSLQQDLFDNLMPGVALAVSVASPPDFSQLLSLDPRVANPFHLLRLRAVAQVRDPVRARSALEKLPRTSAASGVTYSWWEVRGQRVLTASYALGETVSVALVDHTVVVTGGEGEMERALAGLKPFPPETEGSLVTVHLEPQKVAAEVDQIPMTAYGGLAGLTVRSLVARLAEPLTHFGVLRLELSSDATVATAEVECPLK